MIEPDIGVYCNTIELTFCMSQLCYSFRHYLYLDTQ